MKIKVGTDFSGLGSPEEAFKRLNIEHEIEFACEKDIHARKSYEANHTAKIFYDDIITRNNKDAPYVDFYAFGFPCQAFSISGKRLGFEDTRGTLFFNSLEYIRLHRPRVFVSENVKGLISHDKIPGSKSKYGRTFGVIRDALALTINGQHNLYKYDDCVNYHVYFQVLNTKDYGLPQNRERIFIVGFRDEQDAVGFKFPAKIPLKLKLKDLLEKQVPEKYYLSETAINRLLRKESYMPEINPEITGTLNTKNNSGQLSMDKGTTPITEDFNKVIKVGYINQNTQASQVYSTEGVSPTICARSHGCALGYIENDRILFDKENTMRGYTEASEGDSVNLSNPNSTTRRGRVGKEIANTLDTACNQGVLVPLFGTEINSQGARVYDENGIATTQSSQGGGMGAKTGLYKVGTRIRRLTPRECFRLQGYDDSFFDKCQAVNSDTQLYKQAGNSISVHVFVALLQQILKALKIA